MRKAASRIFDQYVLPYRNDDTVKSVHPQSQDGRPVLEAGTEVEGKHDTAGSSKQVRPKLVEP